MVREPTLEQFVFYLRLAEGDDAERRRARRAALRAELASLVAHMNARGYSLAQRFVQLEATDPYVSQEVAFLEGTLSPGESRGFHAQVRTYADAYWLHARYYRKGEHPFEVYAAMRQEDMWNPRETEDFLGQSLCLAGIARLEEGHALAAQILRQQAPPRRAIGDLQTCGFGRARIYRGALLPDISVFLYAAQDAEWAMGSFLGTWLPRWHFYCDRLERQSAWLESTTLLLDQRAAELREAMRRSAQQAGNTPGLQAYQDYADRLTACLYSENAMAGDLASLEWLLSLLPIEGPDTYFASMIRTFRARRQELAANLARWRRTQDQAASWLSRKARAEAKPTQITRGVSSSPKPDDRQLSPDAEKRATSEQLPPWQARGWAPAQAVYFPELPDSHPAWHDRCYDSLSIVLTGPRAESGYSVTFSSPATGEQKGNVALYPDSEAFRVSPTSEAGQGAGELPERSLGSYLFKALLDEGREAAYRCALALARANGRGLRWQLCIRGAPELEDLPWESLYDATEDSFLAASAETPFARLLEVGRDTNQGSFSPPLRILLVVASPQDIEDRYGLPSPAADREIEAIYQPLQPLIASGLVKVEKVVEATAVHLLQMARAFRPHVCHLVAHAMMRPNGERIFIAHETGRARLADLKTVHQLLLSDGSTQLIICCPVEGAPDSSVQALWRAALHFHRFGWQAALGFRQGMNIESKDAFFASFYRLLASGAAVDVSLAEARREILTEGTAPNWLAPALFLSPLPARDKI